MPKSSVPWCGGDAYRFAQGSGPGRSCIVDRSRYRIVQTPQVFHTSLLMKAYRQPYRRQFTDDASVVEWAGGRVYLCEGEYSNIKITTPIDRITAEALLDLGSAGDRRKVVE